MRKIFLTSKISKYYENGLWGLIENQKNEIILKAKYQEMGNDFCCNRLRVKRNDLWGFIDENGIEICPPQFTNVCNYVNGFAKIIVKNMNAYQPIDITKRISEANSLYKTFPTIRTIEHFKKLKKSKTPQFVITEPLFKTGLIDINGNIVIEPEFDDISFTGVTGLLRLSRNERYALYSLEVKKIILPEILDFAYLNGLSSKAISINVWGKTVCADAKGHIYTSFKDFEEIEELEAINDIARIIYNDILQEKEVVINKKDIDNIFDTTIENVIANISEENLLTSVNSLVKNTITQIIDLGIKKNSLNDKDELIKSIISMSLTQSIELPLATSIATIIANTLTTIIVDSNCEIIRANIDKVIDKTVATIDKNYIDSEKIKDLYQYPFSEIAFKSISNRIYHYILKDVKFAVREVATELQKNIESAIKKASYEFTPPPSAKTYPKFRYLASNAIKKNSSLIINKVIKNISFDIKEAISSMLKSISFAPVKDLLYFALQDAIFIDIQNSLKTISLKARSARNIATLY